MVLVSALTRSAELDYTTQKGGLGEVVTHGMENVVVSGTVANARLRTERVLCAPVEVLAHVQPA